MSTRTTKPSIPDNFYDTAKPRLYARIGRELRLARNVIDLGCGSCELVRHLAATYEQKVTGVDIASAAFPARRRGVRFRCLEADAARLEFAADRSADAVVTMWALHEMSSPLTVLTEAYRALRPGGELLIVDFPRNSLAQKLWNENYYRPEQVRRLLEKAGFADIRIRVIERSQVLWATSHRPALAPEAQPGATRKPSCKQ